MFAKVRAICFNKLYRMYLNYYKLNEHPFKILPDPRFLWYSPQHQEAKQKIVYHITQSAGPIYLLADIGTGKTTLAKRIHTELTAEGDTYQVAYINAPKLRTTNAFLRFVMDDFGVKTERSYGASLNNFERYLISQYQKTKPVLLIDEAQNMTHDMLLLIQHLFNFSTDTRFLIQIAMFAQLELQPKLNRLRSLKSRMNMSRLRPLTLQETQQMLVFRWRVAGGTNLPFAEDAIREMHEISKGIPRSIIKLANESLVKAAVDNIDQVERDTVLYVRDEVAESLI